MHKPPRIDIHNHVIPERFLKEVTSTPARFKARIEERDDIRTMAHEQGYAYPLFEEFHNAEAKLAAMDRQGIDIAVISPAPPLFYYWSPLDLATQTARLVNDGVADMAAQAPARLRGMATLPMQHPDAAIAEMERVVRDYQFKAVEIGTSIEGEQLSEARFRPVLRRAQELGIFIFAHPYYVGAKPELNNYYLTNLIGNPLDTTVMAANLMFSGVLDELPDLRICLAHGGGFLPYQIGRLAHGYTVRSEPRVNCKQSPSKFLRNFYFDSLVFDPCALRYLIDMVGADHICIGTDAPFDMGDDNPVQTLSAIPDITQHEDHAIRCETALTLLCEGRGGF